MKDFFRNGFLLLLVLIICSCASRPAATPSEWKYEEDAIHIHLAANIQLNLYEGTPHPLVICFYQLGDPNAFNQLTGDNDGLWKLLECGRFDASVVGSKRMIIHPGQDLTFTLDRAEEAKYVAIVAGYSIIQKEGMVSIFEVPVTVERKGCLWLTKVSRPDTLHINLILGPLQIQKTGGDQ